MHDKNKSCDTNNSYDKNKSLSEIHEEWVKELLRRGEKVLQPKDGSAHGTIRGYIKNQIPHKDAGIIHKSKDGTFEILCDMCQYGITGLRLEDIGLCDAKCWYEWMEEDRERDKDDIESGKRPEYCSLDLKHVKIEDLVEELTSREEVTMQTVSWGKRFPDLSHDEWNIRTGPAKIIIIKTFKREDGYK